MPSGKCPALRATSSTRQSENPKAGRLRKVSSAALTVSDPSETNVGKLVNGAFALTNTLQAYANSTLGVPGTGGNVGGTASPTPLLTFAAPVTNAAVNMVFRQNITATETLRSGNYGKTLTFTLSTTAP